MIAQPSAGVAPAPMTPSPTPTVVVPDWGNQASLFQTRQPAFWLYVVVLGICALLLAGQEFEYLRYSPIAFVVGVILLTLFALPIFLLIGVLDLFEREPLSLMVGAFLWGAIAVFPLALATNNALIELWVKLFSPGLGIGWLAAIIPPPVEEILKFLGVVTIFLIARSEFDDVLDGFVYGALVGLGFQVTEDMFYFFTHFVGPAQGANEIGALIEGYWIRVISSGLYSHPLYAALGGMGLAYWATRLDEPIQRRRMFLIGGLALGIGLHFFWNMPAFNFLLGDNPGPLNWLLYSSIKGIPLLLFILVLVRLATRREVAYFKAVTGPDVGLDIVTPDEMRGLGDLRSRFQVRRAMRARKGPVAAKLLARLQHEQLRYAMIATQSVDNRETMLAAQGELIRTLRAELASMPDVPQVVVAVPAPVGVQPQTVVAGAAAWQPGVQPQPTPGWLGAAQPTGPTWQPTATQPTPPGQPAAAQPGAQPAPAWQPTATAQPTIAQQWAAAQTTAPQPTTPQPMAAQPAPTVPTTAQPAPTWQPTVASQPTDAAPTPSAQPAVDASVQAASTAQPSATTQPTMATPTIPESSASSATTSAAQPADAAASPGQPAVAPTGGGQPAPTWQPSSQRPAVSAQPVWRPEAAVPAGPTGWMPTHRAAAPGQQSWDQPDPSRPMTPLAGNLDLQVVQRVGDWARVVAVNGWSGWVDARLLTPR